MALGTAVLTSSSGSLRASFMQRMAIPGDSAYTTGGTLLFAATYLTAALGHTPTVHAVTGYGYTAGAITHMVRYIASTDALQVFLLATGAEAAAAANLSAVSFDLAISYS